MSNYSDLIFYYLLNQVERNINWNNPPYKKKVGSKPNKEL